MQVSCKLISVNIHRLARLFYVHPLARRCASGWIHSVSHFCEIVSYDCNLEQIFFFSELCAAMKIKARSRKESVEIRVILSWHDDPTDLVILATRECGPDIFILLFMFDILFVSLCDVPNVSNIYECRNFGDYQVPFATKCRSSITQLMQ